MGFLSNLLPRQDKFYVLMCGLSEQANTSTLLLKDFVDVMGAAFFLGEGGLEKINLDAAVPKVLIPMVTSPILGNDTQKSMRIIVLAITLAYPA
jgi:hypothetical protein